MVIANDIFYGVREVDSFQNIAADRGMNLHLGELRFSKFSGLVEDVLGNGELSDVMQQRAGNKGSDFLIAHLEEFAHLSPVELRTPYVTMRSLVLRINGDCQRLDRIHMKLGNLFRVFEFVGFSTRHFAEPLFIKAIEEMDEDDNEETDKQEGNCSFVDGRVKQRSRGDGSAQSVLDQPKNTKGKKENVEHRAPLIFRQRTGSQRENQKLVNE